MSGSAFTASTFRVTTPPSNLLVFVRHRSVRHRSPSTVPRLGARPGPRGHKCHMQCFRVSDAIHGGFTANPVYPEPPMQVDELTEPERVLWKAFPRGEPVD